MNLALFDVDGTITEGDTYSPFLRFAVRPHRVIVGGLLVSPFVLACRLGAISASRARPIVARVGFQGEHADAVRALGRRYAIEVLPNGLRPNALRRETMGLQYICTELEERNGRLTGRYLSGDCSGCRKAQRIRQRYDLSRFPVVYAYGDSTEDAEMLELAHRKYYRWAEVTDTNAVTSMRRAG